MKPLFYTRRHIETGDSGFLRAPHEGSQNEFFAEKEFSNPFEIGNDSRPTAVISDKDLQSQLTPVPAFFGQQVFAFAKNFSPLGEKTQRDHCPLMFIKPSWSVTDEASSFDLTRLTELGAKVWGESELAFTVDQNLKPAWVTVANDITTHFPDLDQDNHLPFYKGQKGFLPLSTRVYHPDLLSNYRIKSISDGKVVRDGGSAEIHYNPVEMLDWLKSWAEVNPGDLILVGSPLRFSGHTYLNPGSLFEIELNGEIVMDTHFV